MSDFRLSGSVPDWLRQRALLTPERPSLLSGGISLTFRELDARVDAAVGRLEALGVVPGGVVALLAGNRLEWVAAAQALARLGAVLQPMNVRLTAAEVAFQLNDAGARLLLFDAPNEAAARAAPAAGVTLVPLADITGPAQGAGASLGEEPPTGDAEPDTGPSPSGGRRFGLSDVHSIVYTSGTTGLPKGAVLTYGNHLWSATASALNLGLRPDDRWLCVLPLFHVGGLAILLRGVIYGCGVVLHERFDPAAVNRAIDEDGVTHVSVVANMLQRMLDERGERPYPPWLRCLLLGGGPAPLPLLQECARRGAPVVQTYGLTETASQIATLAPEEALPRLGSAGKPLFGSELRILDESGKDVPAGVEGEILVRGPSVTPGYYNRPKESARALDGGWLHTGDAGYLDAEGYLYVLDRRDDLIVSGGENVFPAEVEAALLQHAAVLEAGVFGLADERWGQAPAAAVVLRPGVALTVEQLVEHCRGRLARYKLPRRVFLVDELPRNAAGKLLRRELRLRFGG